MDALERRNRRIIDVVLEKERAVCPGTVALIGIYGSFLTGDIHPLSDLDLLILIRDERGRQLATAFVQEDLGVGHDIYCTTWEDLRRDACYEHPHIAKLMDARIVYCADETSRMELETLREQVRVRLAAPFDEADLRNAEREWNKAQCCYADAMAAAELSEVRRYAGGMIYYAENALALLNKTYFRRGVRRRYEELNAMERRPEDLCERVDAVLTAAAVPCLKERLTALTTALTACFRQAGEAVRTEKRPAGAETLSGTYEEMVSNWHGKMVMAAENGDRHLAFMSLESFNEMLSDLSGAVDIGTYDALSAYDPEDLRKTAEGMEAILRDYLREYEQAGLQPKRYADIDAFAAAYPDTET